MQQNEDCNNFKINFEVTETTFWLFPNLSWETNSKVHRVDRQSKEINRNDRRSKKVVRKLQCHVPFIHKFVMLGVTGFPLHNVTLCLLIRQGDGRNLTAKTKNNKNGSIE